MSSVRSRLAADADAQYEKISSTLLSALESTKKAWAFCPHCRKKVQVDHPDHGAQLKAAEMLLEQGFGRVGADSSQRNPEAAGGEATLAELEAMSMHALAAFLWRTTTDGERDRDRRLTEAVESRSWPPGFDTAMFELLELVRENEAEEVCA